MQAIRFSDKQKEMLTLPIKPWNVYAGAVRSGKSHGTMFLIPRRILAHYSEPCLFVGKTLATIERNVLRPLREIFGVYDIGEIKSRQDGGRYVVIYGKECDCVGANDERAISKIHGAEYGYVYVDEATLMPENFFRMLQSRLSLADSCADMTCNPDSPSHYLKLFIDSDAYRGNYIHFSIYDNPFLPKEYVERLEGEYRGTIYFDRWILGNWVRTEGLCYPLFRREKHLLTAAAYAEKYRNNTTRIRYVIVERYDSPKSFVVDDELVVGGELNIIIKQFCKGIQTKSWTVPPIRIVETEHGFSCYDEFAELKGKFLDFGGKIETLEQKVAELTARLKKDEDDLDLN